MVCSHRECHWIATRYGAVHWMWRHFLSVNSVLLWSKILNPNYFVIGDLNIVQEIFLLKPDIFYSYCSFIGMRLTLLTLYWLSLHSTTIDRSLLVIFTHLLNVMSFQLSMLAKTGIGVRNCNEWPTLELMTTLPLFDN